MLIKYILQTVEEHMQLSFSHIMKHWKRNPAAQPTAVTGKVPGSRNVLLRFYPPQSALGWFLTYISYLTKILCYQ